MELQQPFLQTPPPRPKNWLVESILVTIFCCIPFGIAGIVYAASVNKKYDNGDYAEAEKASKEAGRWTKVGFFCGIGILVIYSILFALGMGAALTARH